MPCMRDCYLQISRSFTLYSLLSCIHRYMQTLKLSIFNRDFTICHLCGICVKHKYYSTDARINLSYNSPFNTLRSFTTEVILNTFLLDIHIRTEHHLYHYAILATLNVADMTFNCAAPILLARIDICCPSI